MTKLSFVLTFIICSINVFAQDRETGTFNYSAKNGKHTAKLVITAAPFAKSKHTLTFADEKYRKQNGLSLDKDASPVLIKIDGRQWYGSEYEVPRIEINTMSISFDGEPIAVPQGLFVDCYNPNLGKDYFATKLNEDGDTLLVYMVGSNGGWHYLIMWVLRKDGHHSRFINTCPDCPAQDIFDFFKYN